jgi:hypothetical protein
MSCRILGFLIFALLTIAPSFAHADDTTVSIFDVRKTLPLDADEAVFHDFYLNAGPEAGLKRGMFVSVVRKIPVHDPIKNVAAGTLSIEVAKLQIIQVEHGISVGRQIQAFTAADRPLTDYEGIMIGDVLDLSTISMEAPRTKKTASLETHFQTAPVTTVSAKAELPPKAEPAPAATTGATDNSSVNPGTISVPVPAPTDKGAETLPIQKIEGEPTVHALENFPVDPAADMVLSTNEDPVI